MATEQETDHGRFTITQPQRDRIARSVRKFRGNTKTVLDFSIVILFVLAAIFVPVIAPYPIDATNVEDCSQALSVKCPFDIDDLGRDIFSHVIMESRILLYVGFGATSGAFTVRAVIGVATGYAGGLADEILMRVMNAAMALPPMLLALTLLVVLDPELDNVVVALVFVYMPYTAHISRSMALARRNEVYVEATIARGESDLRIIFSEMFPNCMAPMLVQGPLNVSFAILAEMSLSSLGLGVQPPRPPWGLMTSTGRDFMQIVPWILLLPVLAIGITVVGFNMLGDKLHDVLGPKVEAIK